MSKYNDALDQKVLKTVRSCGWLKFADIVFRIDRGRKPGKGIDPRDLGRALQRLRKQDLVRFDTKTGWYAPWV